MRNGSVGPSIYLTPSREVEICEIIAGSVTGAALYFAGTRVNLHIDGRMQNDAEVIVSCGD